jgi:hypothetical protein
VIEVRCDLPIPGVIGLPFSAIALTGFDIGLENCKRDKPGLTVSISAETGDSRMVVEPERREECSGLDREAERRAEIAGLDLSRSSAVGYLSNALRAENGV